MSSLLGYVQATRMKIISYQWNTIKILRLYLHTKDVKRNSKYTR